MMISLSRDRESSKVRVPWYGFKMGRLWPLWRWLMG